LEAVLAQHALERTQVEEDRLRQLAALLRVGIGVDFFVRARRLLAHAVHSPRYCGSIFRHVGQSWCQSVPHDTTRFGMPLLPSTFAIRHDSAMSSARPSPDGIRM